MKLSQIKILEDLLVAERMCFTEEQASALRTVIRERNGLIDTLKNIVWKYQPSNRHQLDRAIEDAAAIISRASL